MGGWFEEEKLKNQVVWIGKKLKFILAQFARQSHIDKDVNGRGETKSPSSYLPSYTLDDAYYSCQTHAKTNDWRKGIRDGHFKKFPCSIIARIIEQLSINH